MTFYHMDKLRKFVTRFLDERYSKWIFIIPGAILLAFFALPLMAIILRSINLDFFDNAFSQQAFKALRLSLLTSSITTLIAAVFGTPLAYMLARWKLNHKAWLELILDLPIVLPPSVAGVALLITFGRNGLLGSALNVLGISLPFTTAAVVLAQLFVAAPLFIRSARIGFAHIDQQLEESARVEGANQWQLFSEIMLPLSARALASGAILTWTRALGEFGATILFAGNLEGMTQTMPMAIYLGFERNIGVALALSVVLIFVSVILLMLTKKLEKPEE
ncbi:ABC transporter permease [Candidatus Villigracilis affinis]|uniref:ABC transporter permease n=1 Tax=Candidatus Villigracilis affinis TaxID=3140682 RepID=UPI0031F057FC